MRKYILSIFIALSLALPVNLTAAPKSPKLAKCKGKERRPANTYGTILPTLGPKKGPSAPESASEPEKEVKEQKRENINVFPQSAPIVPAKPASKPVRHVPAITNISAPTACRSC